MSPFDRLFDRRCLFDNEGRQRHDIEVPETDAHHTDQGLRCEACFDPTTV